MRRLFAALSSAFVLSLFPSFIFAGDNEEQAQLIIKLRLAAIQASDRESATDAYSKLFARVSDRGLVALKNDTDVGIGLYAAHLARNKQAPEFVAASDTERFVGFLEGRTGLTCPANWAFSFTSSHLRAADQIPHLKRLYGPLGLLTQEPDSLPIFHRTKEQFHDVHLDGHDIRVPADTSIAAGRWRIGSRSIPIRPSFVNRVREETEQNQLDHGRLFLNGKSTFIALWGSQATQFPLFCVDTETGDVLWTTNVWSRHEAAQPRLGSWRTPVVELRRTEKIIGVFGIADSCHYVEGFDLKNGKPAFRFCEFLWNDPTAWNPMREARRGNSSSPASASGR